MNNFNMEFLHAIQHKGKIALLLLVVIFLELFCSSTYTSNISKIGESFNEAYSDRIIAQDYIYKMAGILHRGELGNEVDEIKKLLSAYEKTKLTVDERKLFDSLQTNLLIILQLQKRLGENKNPGSGVLIQNRQMVMQEVSLNQLDKLSLIQVKRMKDLNDSSQKTVSFSSLLNQFDWALLIVIGLTIQVLIFSSNSARPKKPQNQYLN